LHSVFEFKGLTLKYSGINDLTSLNLVLGLRHLKLVLPLLLSQAFSRWKGSKHGHSGRGQDDVGVMLFEGHL